MLIEKVCRIMTGVEKVTKEVLFTSSPNSRMGGHPVKSIGNKFKTNQGCAFVTQCTVNLWNSLPCDM